MNRDEKGENRGYEIRENLEMWWEWSRVNNEDGGEEGSKEGWRGDGEGFEGRLGGGKVGGRGEEGGGG